MDPSRPTRHRRRGSPRGQPRLPNLALIACLFLTPTSASPVSVPVPALSPSPVSATPHTLERRIQGEHVVLADCRDRAGKVSSQMAYFRGDPGPTPQDVAVVVTTPGQAALWVNTNTSGLFTNTGVTFTATLGPKVEEGEWAGTGENGYGEFECWQKYVGSLYTYESTVCSQVYVCAHGDGNTTRTGSSDAGTGDGSGGMAQGTIIGIAVGVVGGVLFMVAAALVFWFWRRWRRQTHEQIASSTTTTSYWPGSLPGDFSPALVPLHNKNAVPPPTAPPIPPMAQVGTVYEVDGQLFRVEMANDHGKIEMDAQERPELKGMKWKQAAMVQVGSPTSSMSHPDSQDSPVLNDQPPSYRRAMGGQR